LWTKPPVAVEADEPALWTLALPAEAFFGVDADVAVERFLALAGDGVWACPADANKKTAKGKPIAVKRIAGTPRDMATLPVDSFGNGFPEEQRL